MCGDKDLLLRWREKNIQKKYVSKFKTIVDLFDWVANWHVLGRVGLCDSEVPVTGKCVELFYRQTTMYVLKRINMRI